MKKVIRPQRDKYILRDFLRDLVSELVVRALSPSCFGDRAKGKNRLSFSVFSLPTGKYDPLCPNASYAGFGNVRVNIDRLQTSELIKMRRGQENTQQLKNYFMIYVSGQDINNLNGNYKKDKDKGIYHLYIGADRGLVKGVEFKRADVQYLRESRIANAEGAQKGDIFLSEPYNVSIKMFGNSIFKPGMILYVDPKSVGMGKSIEKRKRLPLGGYYSVVKVVNEAGIGKYETVLDCTWISSGEETSSSPVNDVAETNSARSIDAVPGGR